jgi:hypothetical protein
MQNNSSEASSKVAQDGCPCHAEQRERENKPVEDLHRQAMEESRRRTEEGNALVEAMHRQAWEMYRRNPPPSVAPPKGVHYTELPEAKPGDALAPEWNTYRREVGRLLAEGHEGRFVLIHDEEIVGLYDCWDGARIDGLNRFGRTPFFVHEIRTEEPYLRVRGLNYPLPVKISFG